MIDLVLLHPPSFYDFRKKPILWGPIADVIPSTPIFEMYPIGFVTLSQFLEKNGYKVRIINVGLKMLMDKNYDAEKEIKKINPKAFGIDLHWLPHAQGGLKLAEIIKKYHPETPVIFGGLSASYYHKELIEYPEVDFVVRGDSTEEPLLRVMKALDNHRDFSDIPNLTYRDENAEIKVNPLTWVPEDLNQVFVDYSRISESLRRDKDSLGYLPFKGWESYPISTVLTCRGCTYNCPSCGGSSRSYHNICKRKKPAYRDPELVIKDIKSARFFVKGPIFVVGDIRQPGEEYAYSLLSLIKKERIENHLVFEFFEIPSPDFIKRLGAHVKNFNIQLSPEDQNKDVRRFFRSQFDNNRLEEAINGASDSECKKLDLFFMIGLSGQTPEAVLDTIKYCDHLLNEFNQRRFLFPYISPLAPFIDPGSAVFENPTDFGYEIFFRSLEEHRKALALPSWKYMLNYQTQWMDRNQIVEISYKAALELNRIKFKHGIISSQEFRKMEKRAEQSLRISHAIDKIMEKGLIERSEENLKGVANPESIELNTFQVEYPTVCEKKELKWPTLILRFNLPQLLLKIYSLTFIIPNFIRNLLIEISGKR
jgi:B12-binding domain/radical SAM domain protein